MGMVIIIYVIIMESHAFSCYLGVIAFAIGKLHLLCLCNHLAYCSCNYSQITLELM